MTDLPGGNEFEEFTEDEQFQLDAVRVGLSMERFLATEAGKNLWHRAGVELKEASDQLVDVDPTDQAKIIKLQLKAGVAKAFKLWVSEYIANGELAADQLNRAEEF